MANVYFKRGTQAQYDALETKDQNSLYWVEDTQRLYNGNTLFGNGKAVSGLTPVDASVVVGGEGTEKTIGVRVSEADGNQLTLNEDGLFVPSPEDIEVPEYEIENQGIAESGYAITYRLKRTVGAVSTYVGDPINIPKDLVLKSGTLEIAQEDDEPYAGAAEGDPYIDLVLNDTEQTHIYIPVKGLVDVYSAGDGIDIASNAVSLKLANGHTNGLTMIEGALGMNLATQSEAGAMSAADKAYVDGLPTVLANKTNHTETGTNGRALMFNENDGGGAKFEHNDGTMSFCGVNDGGKDGIAGQLYVVNKDADSGKYVGTRLNMTKDGFFYTANKNSASFTADDEIATKGDISAAALEWEDM